MKIITSEQIKLMFNLIAKDYDRMNNIMTFGFQKRMRKSVLSLVKNDFAGKNCLKILDLCTGTGDMAIFALELFKDAEITAVDFSSDMLNVAREKVGDKVKLMLADCTQLPFQNEEFDLCMISFGLRNIPQMDKAIVEIYRVLKPKGLFVNLDLGKPNWFLNLFLKPYLYLWVSLLGKVFHGNEIPYKYLAESNENFPSPKQLLNLFEEKGFKSGKIHSYFLGQVSAQIVKK